MTIEKRIENLENLKSRTMDAVEQIRQWWSDNVDTIGRRIGHYRLERLMYSSAYGGSYDEYICRTTSRVWDDEDAVLIGRGYTGVWQPDQNSPAVDKANRTQHVEFLRNFKSQLELHLTKIEGKENEITNLKIEL